MTTFHRDKGVAMARCEKCDHDLVVRQASERNGAVYCSNPKCHYHGWAHATKNHENRGKAQPA